MDDIERLKTQISQVLKRMIGYCRYAYSHDELKDVTTSPTRVLFDNEALRVSVDGRSVVDCHLDRDYLYTYGASRDDLVKRDMFEIKFHHASVHLLNEVFRAITAVDLKHQEHIAILNADDEKRKSEEQASLAVFADKWGG